MATSARAAYRTSGRLTPIEVVERIQGLPEEALILSILSGNSRGFTELHDRYQRRITHFIYRCIGDRERAEDLTQETFIRVDRHLHRFDRTKKFSTWIYTIASNLTKNELRNRSRNPATPFTHLEASLQPEEDRPLQFEDTKLAPDTLFHKRHLRELVDKAIAQMPDIHRDVFILRELEGKSYEEIANVTACNLGTVKSRLNRARTAFAEIIEPMIG
jgi:RNA polymerase sigma-70 factor, ECF subfamily